MKLHTCMKTHVCMKTQKKIWKFTHETVNSDFMTGKRNGAGLVWNCEGE